MTSASPATLFDLDGTLVDSSPGIVASIAAAADRVGLPRPDDATMHALIGPPFPRAFVDVLGVDAATAEAMMGAYREAYGGGLLREVTVYPGVPAVLERLAGAGVGLAVATSKPVDYAREVIAHLGLAERFDLGVHGATPEAAGKAAVVASALGAARDRPVLALVGDRHHDVDGGHDHGLTVVGVTWGFGGAGELTAAGADHLADSPAALGDVLERLRARPAA